MSLEEEIDEKIALIMGKPAKPPEPCPVCGGKTVKADGCTHCPCGWSKCG